MTGKVRLGGMALANGVLVHGPTAWACAVRTPDGEVRVASGRKPLLTDSASHPLVRGPLQLLGALALVPLVRRRLPEARLPMERPKMLALLVVGMVAGRLARGSKRLSPAAQELVGGIFSLASVGAALRGSELAAYHGAEHISIGTYEHGHPAPREHERCGSHLVGPLLATSALGQTLAARASERWRGPARVAASLGAVAVSTELFVWMVRHPEHRLARLLAWPGHELQRRLATAEPTPEQLEVAEAALGACLELERAA